MLCMQVTFRISSLHSVDFARDIADIASLTCETSQFHTSLGMGKGVTVSNSLISGTTTCFPGKFPADGDTEEGGGLLLGETCLTGSAPLLESGSGGS